MLEKLGLSLSLRCGNTDLPRDRFFRMLEADPLRAWYGEEHVLKAAERGAVGKLLISDEIFRLVDRSSFIDSALTLDDCADRQMW